jgi:hypothetical protein
MHYRPGCHVGRYMVSWQRRIGPLSAHIVAYTVVILLGAWEAIVREVRRSMVRYRLLRRHATVTRDE